MSPSGGVLGEIGVVGLSSLRWGMCAWEDGVHQKDVKNSTFYAYPESATEPKGTNWFGILEQTLPKPTPTPRVPSANLFE